jgi:hypothetical protein
MIKSPQKVFERSCIRGTKILRIIYQYCIVFVCQAWTVSNFVHISLLVSKKFLKKQKTSAPTNREVATEGIDTLVTAVAEVALSENCGGPVTETRTVEKNGYWESKKPVARRVYVCGRDGYSQKTAFYYRTDQMPE